MGLFSKLKPVFCVLLFRMLMLGKIMLIIFSNFSPKRNTAGSDMAVSVTFNVRLRLLMGFLFLFFFTLLSCCQNGDSGLPKRKLQQRLSKEVREKKVNRNTLLMPVRRGADRKTWYLCVSVCVCVRESHWKINRWMKCHPNRTSHSGQAEHMPTWETPWHHSCVPIFTLLFINSWKSGEVRQRLPVCWGNVAQRAALGVLVWMHLKHKGIFSFSEESLFLYLVLLLHTLSSGC